ncbi:MAG: hypothetical protein ALAOOOJD_00243 [bacterium]|nr:hypothetical protein [bacterium]
MLFFELERGLRWIEAEINRHAENKNDQTHAQRDHFEQFGLVGGNQAENEGAGRWRENEYRE